MTRGAPSIRVGVTKWAIRPHHQLGKELVGHMRMNPPATSRAPAGAVPDTAATETDTLGTTRYFEVCHSYWREQPNPLNGWNALDGGECYAFAATDAFDALRQWALDEVPVSQWCGQDLAVTGFAYDEGELIIGEVTEHGFEAIDEDAREKVKVTVSEVDRADAARRGVLVDDC